jgi:hypothetical protein
MSIQDEFDCSMEEDLDFTEEGMNNPFLLDEKLKEELRNRNES